MTKVDIISGFLGAGKTTFIKKLIEDVFPGERLVLIENEFGEIGIDGGFLKDAGVEITEMRQILRLTEESQLLTVRKQRSISRTSENSSITR